MIKGTTSVCEKQLKKCHYNKAFIIEERENDVLLSCEHCTNFINFRNKDFNCDQIDDNLSSQIPEYLKLND